MSRCQAQWEYMPLLLRHPLCHLWILPTLIWMILTLIPARILILMILMTLLLFLILVTLLLIHRTLMYLHLVLALLPLLLLLVNTHQTLLLGLKLTSLIHLMLKPETLGHLLHPTQHA